MKILDKYILKTFLKTFLSIFTILIFIFILQSLWTFVRELAGKDLDLIIVGEFLIYLLPTLVPLILPLTILLTSIMVFGDLSENYEFAAMKSAGISLYRAMRGLSIFIFILSVTTFFFANNVIPWGEYQSRNLRVNIAKLTPAMAIAEGQFNAIGDINIKVDKKSGENGNHLTGIILHTKKNSRNTTVIKAESGDLVPGGKYQNVLQLVLYNGNYYSDIFSQDPKNRNKDPHAKSSFEKYTMNIDLSVLNKVDLNEKGNVTSYKMLKISQLRKVVDSLEKKMEDDSEIDIKNTISSLQLFKNPRSRPEHKILANDIKLEPVREITKVKSDIIKSKSIDFQTSNLKKGNKGKGEKTKITVFKGDYFSLFTLKEKSEILKFAIASTTTNYKKIVASESSYFNKLEVLNEHKMGLHNKFALAFSCFILFFVGAPLGAIIRKGGLGLPMIIAVGLFLSYWFIGMFAQNGAASGAISTFLGSWLSTLILLPLGIILTRNATSDKGIFNTDGIYLFFMKYWNKIVPKKRNKKNVAFEEDNIEQVLVKKIRLDENSLLSIMDKHNKFSTVTFILYALILVLFPILKLGTAPNLLPMLLVVLCIGYVILFVITLLTYIRIVKNCKEKYGKSDIFVDFIFGFTSYIFAYFYYKIDIKKLLQQHKNIQQNDSN